MRRSVLIVLLAAYFAHLAVRTLWLTIRYRPAVLAKVPRAPGGAVVLDPVTKQEMETGDVE